MIDRHCAQGELGEGLHQADLLGLIAQAIRVGRGRCDRHIANPDKTGGISYEAQERAHQSRRLDVTWADGVGDTWEGD